jgi:hypothetical protein
MPLGQLQVDDATFPPVPMPCLRCGTESMLRFAGPCPTCVDELHEKFQVEAHAVEDATYEPKMNVTPNAVALKDD